MDNRFSQQLKQALAGHPRLYTSTRRALMLARWAARRPHESDFEFYRYAVPAPPGRVFLDVGAHTGTSALSFRIYDRRTPIVSIEPNATLKPDLELVARLIRGFEYRLLAAGEERGEATLYVPYYRGIAISGEASLRCPEPGDVWWIRQNVPRVRPEEFRVVEQRVPVVPLDDLGLEPVHVKVDVEAHELPVFEGMRRTLAEHRPTILLERSEHFAELVAWLSDLAGYEPMSWDHEARRLVPLRATAPTPNAFLVTTAVPVARRAVRRPFVREEEPAFAAGPSLGRAAVITKGPTGRASPR